MVNREQSESNLNDGGKDRQAVWKNRIPAGIAAILFFASLWPIWSVEYIPSQDGPLHMENAAALAGQAGTSFPDYYYAQFTPEPNTAGYIVMAGLVKVLPSTFAHKTFLTIYILLTACGFWYLISAINPKAVLYSLFCLPMLYNELLGMGFYGFLFGAAASLFAIGYWIRHEAKLNVKNAVIIGAMSLVLYFCHLFAIAAFWLVMGITILSGAIADSTRPDRGACFRSTIKKLALLAAANLPAGALACWYFSQSGGGGRFGLPFSDRLAEIARGDVLVSFSIDEFFTSIGFVYLLVIAAAAIAVAKFRRRQWRRTDWLLAAAGLFLVGTIFFPDVSAGGAYVHQRFGFYCLLVLAAWIAGNIGPGRLAIAAAALAGVIGLAAVYIQAGNYREIEPYIRQYMEAADAIQPNSTFLPLSFNGYGTGLQDKSRPNEQMSLKVAVFYHQDGLIAAQRRAVSLANYSACTDKFIYRYVENRNPYRQIARQTGFGFEPPCADFLGYSDRTGGRVDFVLTWDMEGKYANHPFTVAIRRQLEAGYIKIFESSGGLCKVWRRVENLPAAAPR